MLNFLKSVFPTLAMIIGGSIPAVFTVKALTTPKPEEATVSLKVQANEKVISEDTIKPQSPVQEVSPKTSTASPKPSTISTNSASSTATTPSSNQVDQRSTFNPVASGSTKSRPSNASPQAKQESSKPKAPNLGKIAGQLKNQLTPGKTAEQMAQELITKLREGLEKK